MNPTGKARGDTWPWLVALGMIFGLSSVSLADEAHDASATSVPTEAGTPSRVQYTADSFRDPLISLLPSESSTASQPKPVPTSPLGIHPPALTIQGFIWGGPRPQAVIDGDVYDVGETVGGARIVAIDQQGVTVDVQGSIFQLTATLPGANKFVGGNNDARAFRMPQSHGSGVNAPAGWPSTGGSRP